MRAEDDEAPPHPERSAQLAQVDLGQFGLAERADRHDETKYGKAWLDLAVTADVDLATAAKVALSSMAATALANLSVGPPYDLGLLRRDTFRLERVRIDGDSPHLDRLSEVWAQQARAAVEALPEVEPGDIEVMSSDWSGPV